MAWPSSIEWTDATWNPVTGCAKVSAGCDHCYAFFKQWGAHQYSDAGGRPRRLGKHAAGRVLDGRTWDQYPAAAGVMAR